MCEESGMKQWRLSWEMWPFFDADRGPCQVEKIHDDYEKMMEQFLGLKRMEAPHPPQPCDKHVWDIRVEAREMGDWSPYITPADHGGPQPYQGSNV